MLAPVIEPADLKKYSGMQRAGALMLALGEKHGAPIWAQLSIDEVTELSSCIAELGRVPAAVVEHLLVQFSSEVAGMATLHGSYDSTERLLRAVMSEEKVREIMENIRGPSGRTMWDKLSNVSETLLATYLKNEYPQTVAVILDKVRPDHAARVLAELPQELSADVIMRMIRMDHVQKEVILEVEQTLRSEFMSNLARAQRRDPHETIAEIFNALDRSSEERMMAALDERSPESAERVRSLMFTFEDLGKLLPAAVQTLVRNANKRELALALKGANEEIRQLFLSSMTERAAKLIRSDMSAMGPVRARDCEDAQANLVRLAKSLGDRGEIILVDPKSNDAMIY
ncbi:flagellar motor switch protein FliG [Sphingomonas endophytica]|uniref:Flagellar motor switch protein FliG n=1 Tax=Sphingomonas endophytica TaxID=869719 RepID=A0A7X0JER1_9SPHN|nr:flagellar motor switch protein FliG [Sphingomonas endophytica]MBB5725637.1 flagellar motor switch protein FliG [Sphingomonas endophytica]MBB6505402.1 flagellar motor switch protein FliG [Sphingomonas endophytica]